MPGPAQLRAALEERGLSPFELAQILGIQCRTVRDVLRGAQDVRLRDIALVAQALGFSAGLIIEASAVINEVKKPKRFRVKWR